jgi:hypothetical protein
MEPKPMKARISFLHKTEAEWAATNFTPNAGEIVIYDPDVNFNYARLKIGDGINSVQKLPFVMNAALSDQRSYSFDAGRID